MVGYSSRISSKVPALTYEEIASNLSTAEERFWYPIGSSSPESFNKHDHIRAHSRKRPDQSVMDTGRSFKMSQQTAQRGKSSQTSSSEMEGADTWKLPRGVPAMETVAKLLSPEREKLCQAPVGQVEGFEVLTPRDMASLSKELRALDKRCEYLRKTYKSLRAGRRDLHTRMISYLKKGETVVFSRESLVKQEEALVELDLSIEDWVLKIEQAENRRLRICQKLFEHIAAAIALP
ncbi:Up-regulated during septation-domain-containing protein, partial [Macrophomina phaseolina]